MQVSSCSIQKTANAGNRHSVSNLREELGEHTNIGTLA